MPKTQILLTTHSPNIVKRLDFSNLRLLKDGKQKKEVQNVARGQLHYASLNEINYMAFSEITEEYHNELYGFIELKGWLKDYKSGKSTIDYIKLKPNGSKVTQKLTLTEYIRHQIHHPENVENKRFNLSELKRSIEMMREFISMNDKRVE